MTGIGETSEHPGHGDPGELARPRGRDKRPQQRLKRCARPRWSRDALLRRLLAPADLVAAALGSASLALWGGTFDQAFFSTALAPLWILLAKLGGLYDRDQRALRHLTVYEMPRLFLCGISGVAMTALLFERLPVAPFAPAEAIRMLLVVFGCMVLLRASARTLWRKMTPAERTLIVGEGS
jgi:hypothetical protein